ncbi:hypothetical protein [Sorangium sp. So ce1389]|uniref:hypothetical protein n=1 Tax=Sorangium sp. So ce1389 TaxID=3133336 RepID=UPI003F5ECECC
MYKVADLRTALDLVRQAAVDRANMASLRILLAEELATSSLLRLSDTAVIEQIAWHMVRGALVAVAHPIPEPRAAASSADVELLESGGSAPSSSAHANTGLANTDAGISRAFMSAGVDSAATNARADIGSDSGVNEVVVLEVEDTTFRFDSAVFMPEPVTEDAGETPSIDGVTGLDALITVFIRQKECADQAMLVTGHTDTSGPDDYNLKLSEKRAASVHALLTGERDRWAQISLEQNKPKDIQQILAWAHRGRRYDCDPGPVDGRIGGRSRAAIRQFKSGYNNRFPGTEIPVNESADANFWRAVYDVYMEELKSLLGIDDVGLDKYRRALHWADSAHHFVGCGESWPIDHFRADNYRSIINRRVEVLFFDTGEFPELACHPAPDQCRKDVCVLYNENTYQRTHLPVLSVRRPQSSPYFMAPQSPGARHWIRIQHLYCYVVTFQDDGTIKDVQLYKMNLGQLADPATDAVRRIECDCDVWLYFSHRDDLDKPLLREHRFSKIGGTLPLLGPVRIPCGRNVEVHVDLWQQKDWIIVFSQDIGYGKFDTAKMADWHGRYSICTIDPLTKEFSLHGDQKLKDEQEVWKGVSTASGGGPIALSHWSDYGDIAMWVGTLSDTPTPQVKILLTKNGTNVCTYNQITRGSDNVLRYGFHVYDQTLVKQLEDARLVSPGREQNALIDALPDPPIRFLLPGDMVWYNQGQRNACGPFSFAAAMNYWRPYEFNPTGKDGLHCHYVVVPNIINGARTPENIQTAADDADMNGHVRDAEDLDRGRATKLIKLWLSAGIPVLFLSKERTKANWLERLWSYHWKVLAGYDANRFYMNNSGANQEGEDPSTRDNGFDYEHAPIGNCVNSENSFWDKWKAGGGDIVDFLRVSVQECTFIALYPNSKNHRGSSVK